MTQAFNLSQLANKVNSSGQLNASTGLTGIAPSATDASNLVTTNFTISESGGKLMFYYGATAIASLNSSGTLTTLVSNVTGGTP
jgi:hypothetical protein